MTAGENNINDTFFLAFIGELVEMAGSFFHDDSEIPIKVAGFILDMDDEYYYLGDTPEEITQAIRRERVIYIQVMPPFNPGLEKLKRLEIPEKDEEIN